MSEERQSNLDERQSNVDERESNQDEVEAHSILDSASDNISDHDTGEGPDVEGHQLTDAPVDV